MQVLYTLFELLQRHAPLLVAYRRHQRRWRSL
jgi:hypothetical protein